MKKSIGLISMLMVTTTFAVSCQKAPEKRRVRSNGVGAVATVDAKALPLAVCNQDVINIWKSLHANKERIRTTAIESSATEIEKTDYQKLGIETLAKCDDILSAIKLEENKGCYLDAGVKNLENALTEENMTSLCNNIGKKLFKDVGLDNSYANAGLAKDKVKEENKKVEELKNKEFALTEDGLSLIYEGGTNLAKFVVDGAVKSAQLSLDEALAASKTVCTAIGAGVAKDTQLAPKLKIIAIAKAEENDLQQVGLDFKGAATAIVVGVGDVKQLNVGATLLCLNMDSEKLSVEAITKALSGAIASESSKVEALVEASKKEKLAEEKNAMAVAVKEKAERLEAEAVAAEVEAKKIEADAKSSEQDKKEAQAKAKLTREMAKEVKEALSEITTDAAILATEAAKARAISE